MQYIYTHTRTHTYTHTHTHTHTGPLNRIHSATYGRLSSNWHNSTHEVWRIICAGEAVAVLLMRLNISSGDYLQLKHRKLEGCLTEYKGFLFRKKSILVGHVPADTSQGGSFELGYVCIGGYNNNVSTKTISKIAFQ